ncbi:MAG: enoyl-ACP reductase FabI [Planctomycetota bacterium]|jgi:enoyl-[acyl-carrier protein] reductase I
MGLLEGKTALVSGVANKYSIALGIAQALHEHGARLALTCLGSTQKRVTKLAAQLDSDLVFSCDVSRDDEVPRVFEEAASAFGGRLDVLVHSIATAKLEDLGGEFLTVSREGWRLALETSAYSLVAMARAARPLMKVAGGGSILTLSFAGGTRIVPGYNVMGVAKAALECAVRYLAYDLGPDGIRVNALSPGPIPTASSRVIDGFDESLQKVEACTPLLAHVTPQDVGNAAVFYASDLSKMLTGSVLYIDSGGHDLVWGVNPHPRAEKPD